MTNANQSYRANSEHGSWKGMCTIGGIAAFIQLLLSLVTL
jgi:hypothetical protein